MIFATILTEDIPQACVVDPDRDGFLSLARLFSLAPFSKESEEIPKGPVTMQYMIEHYDVLSEPVLRSMSAVSSDMLRPLKDARILSPIPYPRRNVVCLGKNYLQHVKEIGGITGGPKDRAPDYPIYFTKAASPCNGPGGIILLHEGITSQIDYEAELCVVIGKEGINISPEEADKYIFGYTIGNDISARDVQTRHVNWFKGKSLESHCPIGPWIVEKSHFSLPLCLSVRSYVNGELRQDGNTKDMIRSVPQIISDLSQGYRLLPGDLIMTGTPAGVGMGFHPPRYLHPGDEIRCEIEGIGRLINYMESK